MAGARRKFPRRIESLDEIIAFLQAFADQHEFDARTVFCINLVVEELFTNMVRHNLGGSDTGSRSWLMRQFSALRWGQVSQQSKTSTTS